MRWQNLSSSSIFPLFAISMPSSLLIPPNQYSSYIPISFFDLFIYNCHRVWPFHSRQLLNDKKIHSRHSFSFILIPFTIQFVLKVATSNHFICISFYASVSFCRIFFRKWKMRKSYAYSNVGSNLFSI